MAKTKTVAVAKVLYAGKLPATKKPGETAREKCVRRLLRAAKALDAANANPNPRDGEREGYAKKFDGTCVRMRERLVLDAAAGAKNADVPANDFERVAFALAGVTAKPAKAPARRKPAKVADAPAAAPEADAVVAP